MDKIAFGNFLAELRNEKNITQEKLSEILGINNKTISKWERGNSTPNLEMLSDIAEFYNVSLYELQQGKRIKNKLITEKNLKKIINKGTITKITILKIIGIILLIIAGIVAIFSIAYTFTNYGQMKIYTLTGSDNEVFVDGIFVRTNNEYYLLLNTIKCANDKSLFLNDKTFQLNYSLSLSSYNTEYSEINFETKTNIKEALLNIKFNIANKLLKQSINHFFLNINYRNENNNEIKKTFKIILDKKFSNTRLIY